MLMLSVDLHPQFWKNLQEKKSPANVKKIIGKKKNGKED